jgi:D-alanine transaminase
VLRTRDTTANILRGVTRKSVIALLAEQNIRFEERAFTPQEAKDAREAFITGAGALLLPVVSLDGQAIGEGVPGPVATRLRALYIEAAQASVI